MEREGEEEGEREGKRGERERERRMGGKRKKQVNRRMVILVYISH